MSDAEVQSVVFLKLAFAGRLTLFVTRTSGRCWSSPYPSPVLLFAVIATQVVAALLVGLGWLVHRLPWQDILLVWGYAAAWLFVNDEVKLIAHRLVTRRAEAR